MPRETRSAGTRARLVAASEGVRGAVTRRDGPFGDYSQGKPEEQPRRRSQLA